MDQIFQVTEISLFYNSVNDLLNFFLLKYPFTKMLCRILSLTFFKIILNHIHDLNFNLLFKYLFKNMSTSDPIILSISEAPACYSHTKSIIVEPQILQMLKILTDKLQDQKIVGRLETISHPCKNQKYQKYIDANGGLLFPNNLSKKDIGDGILITTRKRIRERQIKQDTNFYEQWIIEITSNNENFNPINYLKYLNKEFNKAMNNYTSMEINTAYQYMGTVEDTEDFKKERVMEFMEAKMPYGYELDSFHDKEVIEKIKNYTDPFIKKYIELENNKKLNEDFKSINFCLSICIMGQPGTGKTQLCRSIIKYLEEKLGVNLISIWAGMDAIKSIKDGISLYINREVNGKKYRNKGVLIFDNLDNENSILHDTMDKEEVVCDDKVITRNPNSGKSKYIKTIMDSPLTPPGIITLYNCTPEMLEGINPEFKRRMGLIIKLEPHTYNKN